MSNDYESFYLEHFQSMHKDKSDDELRQIVLNNSRRVTAMPTSATPQMIADAKTWLAEAKACNAILSARREAAQERKEAIEQWKKGQEAARLKAILNLPTGITPNGQLVAAILEDEGTDMTAQEIAGWCDELGELEDADLQTLLDNLQRERVIGKKDDKYFLLQAVTGDLYPENTTNWTVKDLDEITNDMYGKEAFLILKMIEGEDHPMSEKEFEAELSSYHYLKAVYPEEELEESDFEYDEYDFRRALTYLTSKGLLTRLHLGRHTFYYYPMIGSKPPMESLEEAVRPKKAVSTENMTQVQLDNEHLKDVIYSVLVNDGGLMAITDIMQANSELENISNQRCSALIRQLVTEGQVERVESERKAFFRAVK